MLLIIEYLYTSQTIFTLNYVTEINFIHVCNYQHTYFKIFVSTMSLDFILDV